MFKKTIAWLAMTSMAFMIAPAVTFAGLGFTDDNAIPSYATKAISELMDQGVISGNDDGSFAPARTLNRAEVAKILVLASGVELDTKGGPNFDDVSEDYWGYDYIETMYNYGWIEGYSDGNFRPGGTINRAEFAKMVVNAFNLQADTAGGPHFDDASQSDWFYPYVETAYNKGLMRGYSDGTFGPALDVTRAEAATITYETQLLVIAPVGPAEGTLEVALSNDTPRGTNVPYNATSVPYTTIEFTASDDSDVEVSALTLTRLGLGDNDDFDNVWLEIDGFKVGGSKSVNNDDVAELRFNPPIVVPAGETLVADVVASAEYSDTDKNTGHHNRIAVVAAEDLVCTAANIVGDFPIEGEEMEVADYKVSELEMEPLGSFTTINVGDNFIEIGKFKLENKTTSSKDVEIRAITLKNEGSAELTEIFENLDLYISGEKVSAETIADGDYVTFRLDNGVTGGYILEDGDSRLFSVRADVVSAEKGDTVRFKVDNFEDIVAVEIGTAFGVKTISSQTEYKNDEGTTVTFSSTCTSAEDECATLAKYTLDTGDLNVSRDPASLNNQNYAPGSNDVVFMTARLLVDQPITVEGVKVTVADGSVLDGATSVATSATAGDALNEVNAQFSNYRLYLNDKLVDSKNKLSGTASATMTSGAYTDLTGLYLDYSTSFEIAGASVMKLVANIDNNAKSGSKLKFSLAGTGFSGVEYISTGERVQDEELLGTAKGSFVEVKKSQVQIIKTDGFSDTGEVLVAGVDDVAMMKFTLDNNDSGDVNVSSLTIQAVATGKADKYQNFTAALFVDGTQQGSSRNLNTSGSAAFNDLAVVVPSAGQKEFTLVVNTLESSAEETVYSPTTAVYGATNTVYVNSTFLSALAVGDTVYVTDDNGAKFACTVGTLPTAVTTGVLLDGSTTDNGYLLALTVPSTTVDGTTAALTIAANSTAVTTKLKHTVQFKVTAGEADNVENGSTISLVTDAAGSLSLSSTNAISGANFELIQSGTLTVNIKDKVNSDILVANAKDQEVLKLAFDASDDEVIVKDIYLVNELTSLAVTTAGAVATAQVETLTLTGTPAAGDVYTFYPYGSATAATVTLDATTAASLTTAATAFAAAIQAHTDVTTATASAGVITITAAAVGVKTSSTLSSTVNTAIGDRVKFKAYNASGQLIGQETMLNGKLHFELDNSSRVVVPKEGSTFVTIKVDVNDIVGQSQTGKKLKLKLDTSVNKGLEAVTAATGADIATPTSWIANDTAGTATLPGEEFVAYKSKLSIKHAANQPTVTSNMLNQVFYRFTLSADANAAVEVKQLTFNISSTYSGTALTAFKVLDSGDQEVSADITGYTQGADVTVAFTDTQIIEKGQSKTYGLKSTAGLIAGATQDQYGVSVNIIDDAVQAGPLAATALTSAKIVWSDSSGKSTETADWLNGWEVEKPSSAQSNSN